MRSPWAWYKWFAEEKGESMYITFHMKRRWKAYCKENDIKPYRQNVWKMYWTERRVRREWRESRQPNGE